MTIYRAIRTTCPRDVDRNVARPPLHRGDVFSGHAVPDRPRWVVLVEAGQRDVYVPRSAVEVVEVVE